MPSTKTTFSSIDNNILADVNGGCGGRRRCGGHRSKTVNIVNNYGAAPAPAAAPAPSGGGGWNVNVQAGYQQA